jgi:hypothetical protein
MTGRRRRAMLRPTTMQLAKRGEEESGNAERSDEEERRA